MVKKGAFNQPTYADLRLLLRSSQGGTSVSSDLASGDPHDHSRMSLDYDERSFYAHKFIVASNSPVINAMLLRAKEQRELHAMGDGLRICLVPVECCGSVRLLVSPPPDHQLADLGLETLELPLEQEELLAGEVLFRSIYSDNLDEEVRSALSSEQGAGVSRVTLLVQVYRLADRLEVCTNQCAQAISALSSADCDSVDVVNTVFSLKTAAPALAEHTTMKALLDKCLSQLVARFSFVRGIFLADDAMQEFQQLEFLPVLAFLESDDLVVASENEVLTLMGLWIGEDRADRRSKEQLRAFWNVLRLGHLTTSFISELAEVAPWLPVDPDVLGDAATWKSFKGTKPKKAASMQKMLQYVHDSSVAWFKDNRKYVPGGVQTPVYFSKEDLTKTLTSVEDSQDSGAQEDQHTARATTYNGYDFFPTLSVQLVSDGSKKMSVVFVHCEFRTSALISKGSQTLAHIRASCLIGKGRVPLGDVDDFLYGYLTWELTRVDTLDDFSCLDRHFDQDGEMRVEIQVHEIE